MMSVVNYFKVFDRCLKRHWCPYSERFTGADSLLTALDNGWQIIQCMIDRSYQCRTQSLTLYVFTLRMGQQTVIMRVIGNPYVERMVGKLGRVMHHNRGANRITTEIPQRSPAFTS